MQFIRKRDEYLRQMERGINIPRLNKEQMWKIKTGLDDLFKHEIDSFMTELESDPGDWDGWCALEGAYEESMHKIRIHILQGLNRDTRKLYEVQQVNGRLQAAREQRTEQVINHQLIRRTLSKMKNILEELTEGDGEGAERDREGEGEGEGEKEGEDVERRRKQAKLTRQVGAVLDLITEDRIGNMFGTQDRREIWNELNTSVDHGRQVIDCLDAMISTKVSGKLEGMNEWTQTRKVREAYHRSPSIAMRRYVDKVQSPQCPIGRETVTAHFTATWAPPREDFEEELSDMDVCLDQKIPAEGWEEMEEYMVEEKHIRDVINSRDDLSACGVDEVSCRLFKAAKQGSIEFMKHIIKTSIRCGRVMTSWKEA
jgi:hypothetical protein